MSIMATPYLEDCGLVAEHLPVGYGDRKSPSRRRGVRLVPRPFSGGSAKAQRPARFRAGRFPSRPCFCRPLAYTALRDGFVAQLPADFQAP